MDKLDKTINKEVLKTSRQIVRNAAKLANERIASGVKRKAATTIGEKKAEADNICIDKDGISVGTKMKREALKLYDNYFNHNHQEKAVVSLGLNSILDLTRSPPQKQLLSDQWDELQNLFGPRFRADFEFEGELLESIKEIEMASKKDIQQARFVCLEKEMKTSSKTHSDIFSMYSQYFELLEFHSYLFEKTIDCTEADLVIKMWSPLIEKLFRRDGLRTKWGESMGEDAGDKATGIKVDLRLVKDTLARRKKEASKANVEVAKFGASPVKITGDSSKLFIESKIIIDNLAKEEPKNINKIIVPSLQIIGNKTILFSVALEAKGVYVAVREKSAFIPSHVSHIKELKRVIKLLLKFKAATMNLMAFGLDGEDKHSSNSSNSNSNSSNSNNSNSSNISWLRDTWVPPTGEKKRLPPLPEQLFYCK